MCVCVVIFQPTPFGKGGEGEWGKVIWCSDGEKKGERGEGIDHPAVENGFISTPKTQEKQPQSVSPYTLGHTAREFENDAVFLYFFPVWEMGVSA